MKPIYLFSLVKGVVLGVFLALGCLNTYSQIYNSAIHYYIKAGESLTSSSEIQIFQFDGYDMKYAADRLVVVQRNLESDPAYYEDKFLNLTPHYHYNSSVSTSKYEVYEGDWVGAMEYVQTGMFSYNWVQPKIGSNFVGFSNDLTTIVWWRQKKDSNSIIDKTYYKEISVDKLKPQPANYDFLE